MSRKRTEEKEIKSIFESSKLGFKDGTEVEKGIVLNPEYLDEHFEDIGNMIQTFSAYPDIFLDMITPEDDEFCLFFYQRIVLRAAMRYIGFYLTAPRAFSKSFIVILALILQCVFMPRTKRFICTPFAVQGAKVAREKLTEIFTHWPLLRREVVGGDVTELPGNYGKDYVTLRFRNGSQFDLVGTTDSTRGGRRHGGLVDEVRDHNADDISEIILPLMNVSRRLPDNTVNPKEPNQQRIFATSAGIKNSFAYDALIDFFELQIIQPDKYITIGCDYRVPVLHGLLDKDYITTLKLSPSYNEESFAREYLSIWGGSSADSWLDFDKLTKYRKIKNPETHAKFREGVEEFYLLSVDVGRLHDQTTVNVFKVRNKNGAFYSSLVNLYVLGRTPETKPFDIQAIHIKRLIEAFKPEEVVIDTNGLGIGLGDEMIKQQIDENGVVYPAYGFFNDNDYKKVQPRNAKQILYGLKANGPLKSKIHSNAYAKITSGRVRFLIKEQEAKSTLMSTKQGQRMSVENRVRRLLPHEMTTRLMEEATNLRLKKGTTGSDIVLEQINSRVPDDKYMGFVYGLWRISEKEEELFTRKKRRNSLGGQRKLVFFNGG